jgi:hypothetical protein
VGQVDRRRRAAAADVPFVQLRVRGGASGGRRLGVGVHMYIGRNQAPTA